MLMPHAEEHSRPFLLDDGTGQALVLPDDVHHGFTLPNGQWLATLQPTRYRLLGAGSVRKDGPWQVEKEDDRVAALVKQHHLLDPMVATTVQLWTVAPGEEIYVLSVARGGATGPKGGAGPYRQQNRVLELDSKKSTLVFANQPLRRLAATVDRFARGSWLATGAYGFAWLLLALAPLLALA